MQRWKIGDVTITKVVEIEVPGPVTWIVPDATSEAIREVDWCQPHFAQADGTPVLSVHSLLVESQGQRIIVDTCVGNDKSLPGISAWDKRQGRFLEDLREAGYAPESIDSVLCTHLHVDHVGWNTRLEDGRWVPTFSNARYLWNADEYAHWSETGDDEFGAVVTESIRPVMDAGLVDLVGPDAKITDEVTLEPTHGHTPGHVSVHIRSRGEEAVITGDLMHHPSQMAHPEWRASVDWDGEMAEATRRRFLERYGDTPVLVIGTHFAGPSAGRIVRDGEVWRMEV